MIRFEGLCEVPVPLEAAFELLADMAHLDRWNPNVTESQRVTGDRLELGSTYESVIRRGPIRLMARSRLAAVDPPHLVEYEGTIGGFWSVDRLTFERSGSGTSITFFNESRPPALLTPLTPVLNTMFQPQARRAVAGARAYLSSL